ncbi:diadenosine 5',5'''-P1,P4-tetraphosphate asymmetrical hydrolase [Coprinopsis cinerea AmutBmut pab1-1]|nr:diadenosine 5',5'''-P1,P4-tetraphosphate asymmetrical hydrolase [Coprinopsis cinerea AmutBmut pab1-1]
MPREWASDDSCAFCRIIKKTSPAAVVYETDKVIAILDILPLREGHTLVIPKIHCPRVSELPPEYAGATGEAVSRVAQALTKALDHTGLNVVCNQEYAQVVPHVHYHVIPAPKLTASRSPSPEPTTSEKGKGTKLSLSKMHKLEFESRDVLDEDEARELVTKLKAHL